MPRALSAKDRRDVSGFILQLMGTNTKPPKGYVQKVKERFDFKDTAIKKVWRDMKKNKDNGKEYQDDLDPKLSTRGRKCCLLTPEFKAKFTAVPKNKRRTYRQAEKNTGVNRGQIARMTKKGEVKSKSSYSRPKLSRWHEYLRMKFCFRRLYGGGRSHLQRGGVQFLAGWNVFHVDEKWFNQKQKKTRALCLKDEPAESRSVIHKNHIPKVMFLSCTTQPAPHPRRRGKYLRGQIAMHAFTAMTAAKVSSHRQPAGTLELKPINVNKDVYLEAMINQILPSIKEHWLKMGKKQTDRLYIQEDNASPHKLRKDPRWVEAVRGWNIRLLPQPPQSPDLNKNDLGFFHSLQTLCWYNDYKSIDELEMKVLLKFNKYDADNNHQKLRDLELIHQTIMKEILLTKGQVVSIPHIHKQKLRKAGKLPEFITMTKKEMDQA
ncbi:unnamed protein product, partial [Heterosigma akashiwo]